MKEHLKKSIKQVHQQAKLEEAEKRNVCFFVASK